MLRIRTNLPLRFALGGHPFKIHIYFDTKSVGGVFNFSTPANTIGRDRETGCINCHKQEANRIQVTGQVPITNALREAPGVDVTDRESVLTYLKEKLNWAVTSVSASAPSSRVIAVVASNALFHLAFQCSGRLPPSG